MVIMKQKNQAWVWWGAFVGLGIGFFALAAAAKIQQDIVLALFAVIVGCVAAFLGAPIYLLAAEEAE